MTSIPKNERTLIPIKWLASETSPLWLEQAIENPIEVLVDHANCERKAAGVALQLMFRYLSDPGLADVLSPLAREELEHFEKVIKLLKSKGHALQPLPAPPYGSLLGKEVRRQEPERMMDSFLVAGLIEARSHERMTLLAIHSPEPDIRNLYLELLESEVRHFGVYWTLAQKRFNRELLVNRIEELAVAEAQILSKLHPEPRIHS